MRWTTYLLLAVLLLCPRTECEAARSLAPISVDKVLNMSVSAGAWSDEESDKRLQEFRAEKARTKRYQKVYGAIVLQVFGTMLFLWFALCVGLLVMAILRRVPFHNPIIIGICSVIGIFSYMALGSRSLLCSIFIPACVFAPLEYGLLFLQNEKTVERVGAIACKLPKIAAWMGVALCLWYTFFLATSQYMFVGLAAAVLAYFLNKALVWLALYVPDGQAYICPYCGYFAKHKWVNDETLSASSKEEQEEEQIHGKVNNEIYSHMIGKRTVTTHTYTSTHHRTYQCVNCGRIYSFIDTNTSINTDYGSWEKA